jgi:hypothetical protein
MVKYSTNVLFVNISRILQSFIVLADQEKFVRYYATEMVVLVGIFVAGKAPPQKCLFALAL